MKPLDSSTWDVALMRLLEDVHTFAMTGPRLHEDWARDVLALMHRAVADPRGWRVRESHFGTEWRENGHPSYPFLPLTAEEVHAWTHPVTAGAAGELLASLAQEWFFEPSPVRARANRDEVVADARTVLGRFGPSAAFRTSSDLALTSDSPDFLAGELAGGRAFTGYMMDLGLIAVSADEVGVFWSFNAL
ncbi:hypothetical protein [Streptomyces sp. NBC_01006]|uniref:hypothetical protein n=1 Tax=Streptomyces sp. NBC_01006 TaxID=2903716 RepID=UPI0038663F0B|nr:hypothetical protein OG509_38310 [Streptomyces sp. NBC_01006]